MRVVLDTNVVISGLLWKGAPRELLDAARDDGITLYTTGVLLDELGEVLARRHLAAALAANQTSPESLMQRYAMLAQVVTPAGIGRVVLEDVDDDSIVACALAAAADLIVSGDADLLNLKSYQNIRIVSVAEALRIIDIP